MGTGNAKRLSGADFEGEFDIMYATADGKPAGRFILRIVRRQEVYALSWLSGDVKRFEGVGIIHRNARDYQVDILISCYEPFRDSY